MSEEFLQNDDLACLARSIRRQVRELGGRRPSGNVHFVTLAEFFRYNLHKGGFAQLFFNLQGKYHAEIDQMLADAPAPVAREHYRTAISTCLADEEGYQTFLAGDYVSPNRLKNALYGVSFEYLRKPVTFTDEIRPFVERVRNEVEEWLRNSNQELPLTVGRTTAGIVRIGDSVRRPIQERAAFVHELLNHLETCGFSGAPRFLGIDDAGREILSFIPGSVPPELGEFSEDQLAAAAKLLRQLHDATLDCPLRAGHEVVCHGDASPCNCVFVEGVPAAFIDFDVAHAGSRTEDLGYASWLWLDLGNEELSADLQGTRIADFFRSYGLDATCAIDAITLAQTALFERTDSSQAREWSGNCLAWVERNRDALTAAITARSI